MLDRKTSNYFVIWISQLVIFQELSLIYLWSVCYGILKLGLFFLWPNKRFFQNVDFCLINESVISVWFAFYNTSERLIKF